MPRTVTTEADNMTHEQLKRVLASPPRRGDARARRLYREAEFAAWERGLRAQIADAEGAHVGNEELDIPPSYPEDLPGLNRLLTRLLETKARMLR